MKSVIKCLIYCVASFLFVVLTVCAGTALIERFYYFQAGAIPGDLGASSANELSGADENMMGWLMLLALIPEVVIGCIIGFWASRWIIKKYVAVEQTVAEAGKTPKHS